MKGEQVIEQTDMLDPRLLQMLLGIVAPSIGCDEHIDALMPQSRQSIGTHHGHATEAVSLQVLIHHNHQFTAGAQFP